MIFVRGVFMLMESRLQAEAERLGIQIYRKIFYTIQEAFSFDPQAIVFNCTGIGSMTLGGVEDNTMFSARVGCTFAALVTTLIYVSGTNSSSRITQGTNPHNVVPSSPP